MNRFSASTHSEAVVAADRARIWAALTDPELLPKLTPLLRQIDTKIDTRTDMGTGTEGGDLWRWHLMRIAALGVSISPMFTERMTFVDGTLIRYTHAPPAGTTERTGAEGRYQLSDVPGGTLLDIDLTLTVELPLPRAAGPAVSRVIKTTMERTGERFSANLLAHLGLDSTATT